MGPRTERRTERALLPPLFDLERKRRRLVLSRYLAEEAEKMYYRDERQEAAFRIVQRWADLDREGSLRRKETALDADFLDQVFGDALGYRSATASPAEWELERNFTVPQVGVADAALGNFRPGEPLEPLVVIELKGADANLDRDKFNGRTPVQQCWDYLNAVPNCPWGIVSNFHTTRLYHRDRTPLAYEEFKLQELREVKAFRQFYCLLERGGLVRPFMGQILRAAMLMERTDQRQREVGDELYGAYSENRYRLIEHLRFQLGRSLDQAVHVAQKLLDRIVFIAFCEDRGLLPPKCIDQAYKTIPPFTKVTNPRWTNFLDLFRAVDQGHEKLLSLPTGYDGGLFRHDPLVDDLQLDDKWTNFFHTIAEYDFRDEVNVDVLGHIFERSVSEIERIRAGGLAGPGTDAAQDEPTIPKSAEPTMPKSAERKRFGIYYTPPEFTEFIVRSTLGEMIAERLAAVRESLGLSEEATISERPTPKLEEYWDRCIAALREIKVCDPACGSGAFLIEAYDLLDEHYSRAVEQLFVHRGQAAGELAESIPDMILSDNLFGVDVSEQAVEITQLALWIRSAQRGKTLADLSRNIVWGNSLVDDKSVHPRAMRWEEAFPAVFARGENGGFDCVIGNPPWERMKLQEREFFALSAPQIAGAVSAAERRKLIAEMEGANPELFAQYQRARATAETVLDYARTSGRFPLAGRGDVNTYMLFVEVAGRTVAPRGRVGLLVPSGIATDHTTRALFADLFDSQRLLALYDFENRRKLFRDVDSRFKFCVLLFGGAATSSSAVDFFYFAHTMDDLADPKRHITLTGKDLALLNPNTRTCPIFRSRRDADLTKAVYRRVPVLVDRSRKSGGNPWGARFVRMFDQTNDAELFRTAEELKAEGFKRQGNRWRKGRRAFLPLYEAKMVQVYDHRAASVLVAAGNWVRQGQTEATTLAEHQNPEFAVQPRWWVDEADVSRVVSTPCDAGFIGFKDITSPTNQRTMIAAAIPWSAVTNHFVLAMTSASARLQMCMLANLNSFALDFVCRQKIGGITLNFFIVEQLPIFSPDQYAERCPWNQRQTLEKWISDRVLKLTCTADDMRPLAEAAGLDPPIHKWHSGERARLIAEIDAAYFLLYGIQRDDAEYILGTFAGADLPLDSPGPPARQTKLVLDAFDRLTGATE